MERLATQRNLKALSTQRILKDMIQDTKAIADAGFLIIVVDDYTVKILSSFLTMTEVLNEGIFSIERLQTKRQPYPKYDALYFISPTSESCELLAKDFENEKKPMYRRIHLFFCHEIIDMILEKIVTPGVVKRTKTCKELNLSFLIRDKNLFDIGFPGALKLFTVKNNTENRNRLLSGVKERLASVCAVLRENPHIQYQANSSISSKLAEYMNAHLSEFFNGRTFNEKRGILLIVDRTIDISTPLLHDYNYETMIYDLFTTKENELEFNDKKYKLDDKDDLWIKYKNKHMCQVFQELQNDFDNFMKNDYSKVNKAEEQSFDEMANVLRDMKGYKQKTSLFTLHLKLAEEITNRYKLNNLYKLIELEQDIITGVSNSGDSVGLKDINNNYSTLKNKIQKKDMLRLITILHACLDITEKDFSSLYAENLNSEEKKPVYNLDWLGVSFSKSKTKNSRREPILTKSDIKNFKLKSKQFEYNFLRSSPKLEGIVNSCSKLELDKKEFPFIQEPKNLTVPKKRNYQRNNNIPDSNDEEEELPYLILFVIGGVSHNEICALENLYQQKALNHHLIIGSTGIMTANDYIEQLKDLSSPIDVTGNIEVKNEKGVEIQDIELGLLKK